MYNYLIDRYGKICLELAKQCKSDVGFGSVLVKNNKILGQGRNRLSTAEERKLLSHVDYAIHAEQAAILDAIKNGYNISNAKVYVLGLALRGKNKGNLTIRTERVFICHKCPHAFIKHNVSVNIPHVNGWMNISKEESLIIGKQLSQKGYWKDFVNKN